MQQELEYTMQQETAQTLSELQRLVASCGEPDFNAVLPQGGWTAGQVARHLVMANGGLANVLYGRVAAQNRAPEEKVDQIRNDMLDFEARYVSLPELVPENLKYDQERMLAGLSKIRLRVIRALETLDLSLTCLDFELPVYGSLTRLETIAFITYHTQRHIHQLRNILAGFEERG